MSLSVKHITIGVLLVVFTLAVQAPAFISDQRI